MKHVVVAIEYLTKWGKASVVKINNAIYVVNFIYEKNILDLIVLNTGLIIEVHTSWITWLKK